MTSLLLGNNVKDICALFHSSFLVDATLKAAACSPSGRVHHRPSTSNQPLTPLTWGLTAHPGLKKSLFFFPQPKRLSLTFSPNEGRIASNVAVTASSACWPYGVDTCVSASDEENMDLSHPIVFSQWFLSWAPLVSSAQWDVDLLSRALEIAPLFFILINPSLCLAWLFPPLTASNVLIEITDKEKSVFRKM